MVNLVVKMKGIVKRFPGVLANDHVDFQVLEGEVHGLLGENGAGKTTLMRILYGIYQPDQGEIFVRGKKVTLKSPLDAIRLKIGMVHQFFMLVPNLTVTQNVVLGLRSSREPLLDLKNAEKKITELSEQYGFKINPMAKVCQLSVGEQQRVEIIKALYREAQVLILDEPTSVLTPPEASELFIILRRMVKENGSVIFITHKLHEALTVTDRITVLRDGRVVATLNTPDASEKQLARLMIGREAFLRLPRTASTFGDITLNVKNLQVLDDRGLVAVKGVSFSVRQGEIFGIAGVAGNGQKELVECISGLRKAAAGKVFLQGEDVTNQSPKELIKRGMGHIPEDRLGMGILSDLSIADNAVLKMAGDPPFAKRGLLNRHQINHFTQNLVQEYDIKVPSVDVPAGHLSGGNLQKLILARELSRKPKLLIACQLTKGLDVGATEFIRRKLLEERNKGMAILLISEDLDEVCMISDTIAVMYEGEIVGIMPAEKANTEDLGLLMSGLSKPIQKSFYV